MFQIFISKNLNYAILIGQFMTRATQFLFEAEELRLRVINLKII